MKKRIVIIGIALVLALVIACTLYFTFQNGSQGILYRVTGDHGSAYVLGSIHIGSNAMHPFGEELMQAMADSDIFVFESDTSSAESLTLLAQRQLLPENTNLSDILGDTLYKDVVAAYNDLHLSTKTLSSQQPWAVINTLAVYSTAAEMGVQNIRKAISLGVEPAVQTFAEKHHKSFAYLESIDEIADTMESFSDSLNRYLLQDEIDIILKRKIAADAATVKQWPAWWHNGDAESFRSFYLSSSNDADPLLTQEYETKLITQRNQLMADRLDKLLQQGGRYFVTVGLLHLLPEGGSVLTLLQNKGYNVERIIQP